MIPVPVLIGVPVAGYAVWRAFGPKKRQASNAANNWRNEDYADRERKGRGR